MLVWLVAIGLFLTGCSSQTKVVYKEPEIVLGEPYKLRDGSICRDVVIYKGEGRREVEVKTLCVR